LIDLQTAVYFEDNIDWEDASHLFHDLMLKIAGLWETRKG
jgi:hypothetical protein